jgi:site-specific DNA-methyltransferase (cytosine-N4-specific)
MLNTSIESALAAEPLASLKGKVNLIFTSPPFPLVEKKKYGNLDGEAYLTWITGIATTLSEFLALDGSFVIEIGNAWERGRPVMSTLPIETLLAVSKVPGLHLCQQFICHNPARIPGPAQWVTVERIRVKDAFTQVWWFAKTPKPKASNRSVLVPYTAAMQNLLKRRKYNPGMRPSGHRVSEESFFIDNGGAIPANVLVYSNTAWSADYRSWCAQKEVNPHPARMSPGLAEFFIRFLTEDNDLVLDPFGGSNTTGAVAEQHGRRWITVEPDPDYVLGSRGRFAELRQAE